MYIEFKDLVEIAKRFNGIKSDEKFLEKVTQKHGLDSASLKAYKNGNRKPIVALDACQTWFPLKGKAPCDALTELLDVIKAYEAEMEKKDSKDGTEGKDRKLLPIRIITDTKDYNGDDSSLIGCESAACSKASNSGDWDGFLRGMLEAAIDNSSLLYDANEPFGYPRAIKFSEKKDPIKFSNGDKKSFNASLREMLRDFPFIILTGEGGIGKTTFLKRAEQASAGAPRKPVKNIYIDLKSLGSESAMLDSAKPPVLLLLDGYNEIPSDVPEKTLRDFFDQVRELTRKEDVYIIVSDRYDTGDIAADMEHWDAVDHFHYGELLPLPGKEVKKVLGDMLQVQDTAELLSIPLYLETYKRTQKKQPDRLLTKYSILDMFSRQMEELHSELRDDPAEAITAGLIVPYIAYRMILDNNAQTIGHARLRIYTRDFSDQMKDRAFAEQMLQVVFPGRGRRGSFDALCEFASDSGAVLEKVLQLRVLRGERDGYSFAHQDWRDYYLSRYAMLFYDLLRLGDASEWSGEHPFSIRMFDADAMKMLETALFGIPVDKKNSEDFTHAFQELAAQILVQAQAYTWAQSTHTLCLFLYFIGYDLWRRGLIKDAYHAYISRLSEVFKARLKHPGGEQIGWGCAPHIFAKTGELYRRRGEYGRCLQALNDVLSICPDYYPAMHQEAKAYLFYAKDVAESGLCKDPDRHIVLDGVPDQKQEYVKALLAKSVELFTKCGENGHMPSYNSLGLLFSYPPLAFRPYVTVDWVQAFLYFFKVACCAGEQRLPESCNYACRQCATLIAEGKVSISDRVDPSLPEMLKTADVTEVGENTLFKGNSVVWIRHFLSCLRNQDDVYINYLNGLAYEREGNYASAAEYYHRCCKLSNRELMPMVRLYALVAQYTNIREKYSEISLESLARQIRSTAKDISNRSAAADQYDGAYTLELANYVLQQHRIKQIN